jgi:hypothetical protein
MPELHQVRCITKSDRYSPHERIRAIGGRNPDGNSSWYLTQEQAIEGIESGRWAFFVDRGGAVVDVIVATSSRGNKYLKTAADGEQPNNLLSLCEC